MMIVSMDIIQKYIKMVIEEDNQVLIQGAGIHHNCECYVVSEDIVKRFVEYKPGLIAIYNPQFSSTLFWWVHPCQVVKK